MLSFDLGKFGKNRMKKFKIEILLMKGYQEDFGV